MDAEQIRDGVKYMQQGDKAYVLKMSLIVTNVLMWSLNSKLFFPSASKGIFRKPDWDVAAGYYDRAGKNFFFFENY
jgi:hypothetical protein